MNRSTLAICALGGAGFSLAAILVLLLFIGLNDRTTPLAVTLGGALATTSTGLASWFKASEASREAKHARRSAEYSVSQTAALQQDIMAHCGEICPMMYCPLRRREEQEPNT